MTRQERFSVPLRRLEPRLSQGVRHDFRGAKNSLGVSNPVFSVGLLPLRYPEKVVGWTRRGVFQEHSPSGEGSVKS